MNMRASIWGVLATLGSGGAVADEVAVSYSLLPAASEGEMNRGQIVLQVTNVSNRALDDVSIRAEWHGAGHVAGPALDSVDLGVGEIVLLRGDYVIHDVAADGGAIAWRVSWRDAAGELREETVAGVRRD